MGDQAFVVVCDEHLRKQAFGLLSALEELFQEGSRFKAGETFNFGGLVFSFHPRGADLLVGRPVVEGLALLGSEEDVTPMLRALVMQLWVAQQVDAEPTETNILAKVILERGCLEKGKVFVERKAAAFPNDSGWFIGAAERSDSAQDRELATGQVWNLFYERPALLSALALPEGYAAVFEGRNIVAVLDPHDQNLWKDG